MWFWRRESVFQEGTLTSKQKSDSERECVEESKSKDRDRGRQQAGWSLCLTHTHCGLVMLLEDWWDISRLLLTLLCIVLPQRRPLSGPAPGFLSRLAGQRWSVCSSFAVRCPAAQCPEVGTGLTGQLSTAVWMQWGQSKWVTEVHMIQAVASWQPVSSLQGREELTGSRRVLLWRVLQERIKNISNTQASINILLLLLTFWSSRPHLKERSVSAWYRGGGTLGHLG